MAGVFDLNKGAFDSSEAERLYQAYDIALQGLKASHSIDQSVGLRLAKSIVKVVRTEPDCLRNDGTIDPARLAQRAILRMLQVKGSIAAAGASPIDEVKGAERPIRKTRKEGEAGNSTSQIMMHLFDRTIFAKL